MTRLRQLLARLLAYIALVPGRRVTVGLINGEVLMGRVRSARVGSDTIVLSYTGRRFESDRDLFRPTTHPDGAVVRDRADEGVSWCRGRRGRAVHAFLAGWALR